MAEFDVNRVSTLEWVGIGAGALAFVVSFFPWISLKFGALSVDVSGNAWDAGFLAWFSVLLLLGAAVVVVAPHFGTEIPNRSQIWLGGSALAFVSILLRWVSYDEFIGAGVGLFLGLILAIVSGAAAFRSTR